MHVITNHVRDEQLLLRGGRELVKALMIGQHDIQVTLVKIIFGTCHLFLGLRTAWVVIGHHEPDLFLQLDDFRMPARGQRTQTLLLFRLLNLLRSHSALILVTFLVIIFILDPTLSSWRQNFTLTIFGIGSHDHVILLLFDQPVARNRRE